MVVALVFCFYICCFCFFFFKQKTAYEMRISDWSSVVALPISLRDQFGIAEGGEWEPYGGLGDNAAASLQAFVERSPLGSLRREPEAAHVTVPVIKVPEGAEQSTQAAFGRIPLHLAKSGDPTADRFVTTFPYVTLCTNSGSFVNQ